MTPADVSQPWMITRDGDDFTICLPLWSTFTFNYEKKNLYVMRKLYLHLSLVNIKTLFDEKVLAISMAIFYNSYVKPIARLCHKHGL